MDDIDKISALFQTMLRLTYEDEENVEGTSERRRKLSTLLSELNRKEEAELALSQKPIYISNIQVKEKTAPAHEEEYFVNSLLTASLRHHIDSGDLPTDARYTSLSIDPNGVEFIRKTASEFFNDVYQTITDSPVRVSTELLATAYFGSLHNQRYGFGNRRSVFYGTSTDTQIAQRVKYDPKFVLSVRNSDYNSLIVTIAP